MLGPLEKRIEKKDGYGEVNYTLRGISARSIRRYLSKMGGKQENQNLFRGESWQAEFHRLGDVTMTGDFKLTRHRITFRGDYDMLKQIVPKFQLLTLRAAG